MSNVSNNIDRFFDADAAKFSASYINYLTEVLHKIDINEIKGFVNTLLDARERGTTVFFIGNGGSAATSAISPMIWLSGHIPTTGRFASSA